MPIRGWFQNGLALPPSVSYPFTSDVDAKSTMANRITLQEKINNNGVNLTQVLLGTQNMHYRHAR